MTSIVETLNATQVAQAQSQASAVAGAAKLAVNPGANQFVFVAAFDGTDNGDDPSLDGSNDVQTTAVRQLQQQVTQSVNVVAGYYAGVGTPGTDFGSSFLPSAVTSQSIKTAQNAYDDFAHAAYIWANNHPGGSITSVLTSFSRGGAAAAIFAQMLYESGLVYADPTTGKQTVLIAPGAAGSVAAALILDPVLTGLNGNMDFPPSVQNLNVIRSQNEYRNNFDAESYAGDNANILSVMGNHGDAGALYGNIVNGVNQGETSGLGGIYLQGYTQFLRNTGIAMADVPASRAYISESVTPSIIHSEVESALSWPFYDYSTYNPSNDLSVAHRPDSHGSPVNVVGSATIFTAYNGDIVIGGTGYNGSTGSKTVVLLPRSSASIAGDGNITVGNYAILEFRSGITLGELIKLTENSTLKISDPEDFSGYISNFIPTDTIDLAGIDSIASASLRTENVLHVQSGGAAASLQFDPSINYADDSFVFGSDGSGGTNIAVAPDSGNITLPSGNAFLLVNNPAKLTSVVSGDDATVAGTIYNFTIGDTIDLVGIGTATSATLGPNNVLTVKGSSGSASLNLDPAENFFGESFSLSGDGVGGTDVRITKDSFKLIKLYGSATYSYALSQRDFHNSWNLSNGSTSGSFVAVFAIDNNVNDNESSTGQGLNQLSMELLSLSLNNDDDTSVIQGSELTPSSTAVRSISAGSNLTTLIGGDVVHEYSQSEYVTVPGGNETWDTTGTGLFGPYLGLKGVLAYVSTDGGMINISNTFEYRITDSETFGALQDEFDSVFQANSSSVASSAQIPVSVALAHMPIVSEVTGGVEIADTGSNIDAYRASIEALIDGGHVASIVTNGVTLSVAPNVVFSVVGGGNVISGGAGDSISLGNTGAAWDALYASGAGVILTNANVSVLGGGNVAHFATGTADNASLYNTGNNWDTVYGSGGQLELTNANASVVGGGNTVYFVKGTVDNASLYNTGVAWDTAYGTGEQFELTNANASVVGGGNTVYCATGTSNNLSLYSTGGNWNTVYGSGGSVALTGAQASVVGGTNLIYFLGSSGNGVSLYNTGVSADAVKGSSGFVGVTNAAASITGNNDFVQLAGNDSVTANGNGEWFGFGKTLGTSTITGFNATDALQFSAADFANWQALQPHIAQSGANTTISLAGSGTITLANVAASSLSAAEFHFA